MISVKFYSPNGSVFFGEINNLFNLTATLMKNSITELTMETAPLPREWLARNTRVGLFLNVNGRSLLFGQKVWLIKYIKCTRHKTYIRALSANVILGGNSDHGRIVAYASGSPYADISGVETDVAIKGVVNQCLGSLAGSNDGRALLDYVSIEDSHSGTPAVSKAFAWRGVGRVIGEMVAHAESEGVNMHFDIIATDGDLSKNLEFRTWVGLRGQNRPIVFSEDQGNLIDGELVTDYSEEVTAVYVGGPGLRSDRIIRLRENTSEIDKDPFARVERFLPATQAKTNNALDSEGDAELHEKRAVTVFSGTAVNAEGSRYGVDWSWGDRGNWDFLDQSGAAVIDAVMLQALNGNLAITGVLKNE